jgi:N utilization substance protein B
MQILYQIDATGEADAEVLAADLDDEAGSPALRGEAVQLAVAAWKQRETYDQKVAAVAPDWPTHRQPPVDRAILRLALHEMITGRTPGKIAINEAVELAKQFSNENAPSFINGVLDKLHRTLDLPTQTEAPTAPPVSADAWLDDAKSEL